MEWTEIKVRSEVSIHVGEVRWGEMIEVNWGEVKRRQVCWTKVSKVGWGEVRQDEVDWTEVRWGAFKRSEHSCWWDEVNWGEIKWRNSRWTQVEHWSETLSMASAATIFFPLKLEINAAEAVKTSITNSLSQDCTNLDDPPSPTRTDSPELKAFTLIIPFLLYLISSYFSCFDSSTWSILPWSASLPSNCQHLAPPFFR